MATNTTSQPSDEAQQPDSPNPQPQSLPPGVIAVNCSLKYWTAAGVVVVWAAGTAYFLHRYRDNPETVKSVVKGAIVPFTKATAALVTAILSGSFKILVEIRTLDALDEIWKSYNEGDMKTKLEKVIVTDDLRSLAPDDAKNVHISLEISEDDYGKTRDYLLECALQKNREEKRTSPVGSAEDNNIDDLFKQLKIGRPEENIEPNTPNKTGDSPFALKEFDNSKEVRDSISGSKIGPSEQLFNNLQRTIKDICERLAERKEVQTQRLIEKILQETSLKEDDNVSELFDKDLGLKTNIIVQLDIDSKEEEKLSSFAIDLKRVLAAGTSPFKEANLSPPIYTQTNCESKDDKKLKPGDFLETLWENQYFKDDLSEALDFKHPHSDILNYSHLAQEFKIPKKFLDSISCSKNSPSEQLFDNLQTTMPDLKIKVLCEKLTEATAFQTGRLIEKSLRETRFKEDDNVFELFDKDCDLKKNIIIQLDSKELWKKVADKLKIPEQKWSCFPIDQKCDPARYFFDVLKTQSPHLKTSTFKEHLRKLEQKDILKKMKKIKDESLLSELSSHAALMCDVIRPKLNKAGNDLLYKLAESFQEDGYLKEVDINTFIVSESYESPTVKMMDYIVCSQPIQYKIQHLVDRLANIKRGDCCKIISKYVKDLQYQEVEQKSQHDN